MEEIQFKDMIEFNILRNSSHKGISVAEGMISEVPVEVLDVEMTPRHPAGKDYDG